MVVIVEMPNELLSWRYAAALEARDAGQKEEANKMLAELLENRPKDPRFLKAQFFWNREDGKHEAALEILQQLISGEVEGSNRFAEWVQLRGDIYLHLKRYSESIADCLELIRMKNTTGMPEKFEREQLLNQLAYSRALGAVELDAALIDIDAAIAISRSYLQEAEQLLQKAIAAKKSVFAANQLVAIQRAQLLGCLDTRGLVHYKREDYAAAQADFDEAVQLTRLVREFFRVHEKRYSETQRLYRTIAKQKKVDDQHDAVIYYHRSLNLRKLGRDDEAQRDWDKARELIGKEPDESLF